MSRGDGRLKGAGLRLGLAWTFALAAALGLLGANLAAALHAAVAVPGGLRPAARAARSDDTARAALARELALRLLGGEAGADDAPGPEVAAELTVLLSTPPFQDFLDAAAETARRDLAGSRPEAVRIDATAARDALLAGARAAGRDAIASRLAATPTPVTVVLAHAGQVPVLGSWTGALGLLAAFGLGAGVLLALAGVRLAPGGAVRLALAVGALGLLLGVALVALPRGRLSLGTVPVEVTDVALRALARPVAVRSAAIGAAALLLLLFRRRVVTKETAAPRPGTT